MRYLRNIWYVAGWADEIGRDLQELRILDEPILFYRKEDGTPVAIGNRCPHRFAPLHMGRLDGDNVVCGYHGLAFNTSGVCVHMPNATGKIPARARVKAYPVAERHALTWIWMGDPERADESLIPDMSYLADKQRHRVQGKTLTIDAHYEIYTDNLLDLTHVEFLHGNSAGIDFLDPLQHTVEEIGSSVVTKFHYGRALSPGAYRSLVNDPDARGDFWLNIRWDAPSVMTLEVGFRQADDRAFIQRNAHILTPVNDRQCRYIYAGTRDWALGDAAIDEQTRAWHRKGFLEEDKPMVEAVSRMMDGRTLEEMKPMLLSFDAGPMRVRRLLSAMIDREEGETAQARPVAQMA
jgi:vanillate O-demethylase monooxygenase subunit